MTANMNPSFGKVRNLLLVGAAAASMLTMPGAFAQDVTAPPATDATQNEIQQFCTNIADAARDQRYVLQRKDLETLQASIDERIATLEKRRDEYEDWLKRRNDFLKQAQLGLVDIYKTMKPDAAAGKLEMVNPEIAAAIVMQLPPRQSSLILSEMTDERAAILTNIISSASDPNTSKEPS
ncbi:MotE family protein [Ensifer sp. ENS10]|jgi:flagellar motility protein MotE (MotC chaperone)|uniref:MotE family protein n=2 Tax=Sinorhizobium/Ensifer group TaxID=227292 RepID=UPI00070975C1|nr:MULTISPECIES: MotE family protein [Sinorhizobium/Ensifer group]KRD73347.1 flagellar protein [Ensifer sp. Root278]KSV67312.1 flagellar protein [Sinorhizobium sp. Sb3]KSV88762.1 flagellar protein [Sinorhizobium sp. GL28]MBD9505725.1 MotE family protein [Ensifer sp. ENS10]